ncbi:MAG: hypothetical protein WAL90_06955 [Desulfobacterales bacterium]
MVSGVEMPGRQRAKKLEWLNIPGYSDASGRNGNGTWCVTLFLSEPNEVPQRT